MGYIGVAELRSSGVARHLVAGSSPSSLYRSSLIARHACSRPISYLPVKPISTLLLLLILLVALAAATAPSAIAIDSSRPS